MKTTQLPQLDQPCLKCGFDFLMPSRAHGVREEFLQVIGVDFYRCHKCEARYTRVGSRNVGVQSRNERSHVWVLAAIGIGLFICAALALYVQKLAHRWPF